MSGDLERANMAFVFADRFLLAAVLAYIYTDADKHLNCMRGICNPVTWSAIVGMRFSRFEHLPDNTGHEFTLFSSIILYQNIEDQHKNNDYR